MSEDRATIERECVELIKHMSRELHTRRYFPFGGLTEYSHSTILKLAKKIRNLELEESE